MRILLLYIPVLHAGYLKLFEQIHPVRSNASNGARNATKALFILGDDLVQELHPLHKEIRAVPATTMQALIASLNIFPTINILNKDNMDAIGSATIVTADEAISRACVEKYFPKNKVEFLPVFLRWDEKNVKSDVRVQYDRISTDPFDRTMMEEAKKESEKSGDWWRHIGAVLVQDGAIVMREHNHHLPSDYAPYAHGDPRDVVEAGTSPEIYTSIHAEQSIVARAAKQGLRIEGTSIYMNIFPCPPCAKIMATAGITKCYFAAGSAWLDAESVLRAHGVEIILVQ